MNNPDFNPCNETIRRLYDFFQAKYGLGIIGLLKCISVASIRAPNCIPLSILVIGPSRQYKSKTSKELENIFPVGFIVDPGSDFTILSIYEDYNRGRDLDCKTLSITDLTLLIFTKEKRQRERLISGLAMLLSDKIYKYSDSVRGERVIECCINVIANVTLEAYNRNKAILVQNTFGERFLKLFYRISFAIQEDLIKRKVERMGMTWQYGKIELDASTPIFPEELHDKLDMYTKELALLSLSTNLDDMADKLKSILIGYVKLEGKAIIEESDFEILDAIRPYLGDTSSKTYQIQQMYLHGSSVPQIMEHFGYGPKSKAFVYRCIKELKERGVTSK